MTLDELIDRLRQAKWPSRELDAHIACVANGVTMHEAGFNADTETFAFWENDICHNCSRFPRFTQSIDAALTLVPEGWFWRLASFDERADGALAEVVNPDVRGVIRGEHDEPAIAMCIAAMKAKKLEMEHGNDDRGN